MLRKWGKKQLDLWAADANLVEDSFVSSDDEGRTPFYMACLKSNKNVANGFFEFLINYEDQRLRNPARRRSRGQGPPRQWGLKAKVIQQDKQLNKTPLHLASGRGLTEVVERLRDYLKDDPAHLEALQAQDSRGQTPLHLASESGHSDVIEVLLGVPKKQRTYQFADTEARILHRERQVKENTHKARMMVRSGLGTTVFLWVVAFGLALYRSTTTGQRYKNAAALWSLVPTVAVWDTKAVDLQWPSPFFTPVALACAHSSVFIADRYHVYEMATKSLTVMNSIGDPVYCPLNGTIQDVTVFCEPSASACEFFVLLRGFPSQIVDCSRGSSTLPRVAPLLQSETPATQLAMDARGMMYATHGDQVVKYRWASDLHGWSPLWPVAELPHNELQSLAVSNGLLWLFKKDGVVEGHDLQSMKKCGALQLPPGILSGCTVGQNSAAYILLPPRDLKRALSLQLPEGSFRACRQVDLASNLTDL